MYYKFERIWKEAVVGTAVPAFAWRDWGKPWKYVSGIGEGQGDMQKHLTLPACFGLCFII